jgi:hypothetical protein
MTGQEHMNRQQRTRVKIQAAMIRARLNRLLSGASAAERHRLEQTLTELIAQPGVATVYPAPISTTIKKG